MKRILSNAQLCVREYIPFSIHQLKATSLSPPSKSWRFLDHSLEPHHKDPLSFQISLFQTVWDIYSLCLASLESWEIVVESNEWFWSRNSLRSWKILWKIASRRSSVVSNRWCSRDDGRFWLTVFDQCWECSNSGHLDFTAWNIWTVE